MLQPPYGFTALCAVSVENCRELIRGQFLSSHRQYWVLPETPDISFIADGSLYPVIRCSFDGFTIIFQSAFQDVIGNISNFFPRYQRMAQDQQILKRRQYLLKIEN